MELCAGHPGIPAIARCSGCGRWACDVCALPGAGGARCPACWAVRVPWEERERIGTGRAFLLTLRASLFTPASFFERLAAPGPVRPALRYSLWTHALGASSAVAFTAASGLGLAGAGELSLPERAVVALFLLTAVSTLWLLCDVALALLIHGVLRLQGEARGGLAGTVRAVCYGGGAGVLYATLLLPSLFVPQLWAALATVQAVRGAHGTGLGRAATAVLTTTLAGSLALVAALALLDPSVLRAVSH
ncbi:MAG: hypothetical protein ACYDCL_12005 [Myxococcales bacterium]